MYSRSFLEKLSGASKTSFDAPRHTLIYSTTSHSLFSSLLSDGLCLFLSMLTHPLLVALH